MKTKQKGLVVFLVLAMVVCCVLVGILGTHKRTERPTIIEDGGYVFEKVEVDATVTKSNTYQVRQSMTVRFGDEDTWGISRGIYLYIPTDVKTSLLVNGKQKNRRYDVDITMKSATTDQQDNPLALSNWEEDGNYVLKMQHLSPVNDKTVRFDVQYDLTYGDDKVKECDFVYFNIWGTFFTTKVEQLDFRVTLPEGYTYQQDKTYLYKGAYGTTNNVDASILSYDQSTRTFSATMNDIPYATGVTLLTYIENGFFTSVTSFTWSVAIVFAVLLALGLVFTFVLSRRGQAEPVISVQLTPPDDMDPLAFSKTLNHTLSSDLGYMVIYYANRGYLKIHYKGKKVESDSDYAKAKDIVIEKVKEIDEEALSYNRSLFHALFDSIKVGDSRNFENLTLKYEEYMGITSQLDDKYGSTISNASLAKTFVGLMATAILVAVGIMFVNMSFTAVAYPAVVPLLLLLQGTMYFASKSRVIEPKGMRVGCRVLTIFVVIISLMFANAYYIVTVITSFLLSIGTVPQQKEEGQKNVLDYLMIAIYIMGVAVTCFGSLYDPLSDTYFLSVIMGILGAISSIFVGSLPKYNTDNLDRIGKVLGYRRKLLLVDVNEIEKLVKDNPSYYYDVLPYVYVMGIEDEFSKKFANIKITSPSWYEGDVLLNYWLLRSMMHTSHAHVISHLQPKVTKSGSFGGFGGGGHSGGFGGFSGGGFGGGGGGRC